MKIKELQGILREKKCDLALFYNSEKPNPNMQYFTGYTGIGIFAVPKDSKPFIMVPEMEIERAKTSGIKTYSMVKKKFFQSASEVIKKHTKTNNVAIDNNNFTLNSYKAFKKQFRSKTKDISLDCIGLRTIKTSKEIEYLKAACHEADMIVQKTFREFKDFKTESDVAAFLEYQTKRQGLELSFNPIVGSGKNGSMPHYEPKKQKLNKGLCVIDFGVKYKGYCSDMTRTISIGNPSKDEKQMYNLLLEIENSTINMVKNEIKCHELYELVVQKLGKYSKNFTHGLGHGVGVEIHEIPNLTLNSKDKIINNIVFTIEPGVYFPGKFGIRIEDTILFQNKNHVLTGTTKDLLIL